ncbi:hypothetical protein WI80_30335 [Burkholderia ubonensis]|nr:hypothetical protein WI80_30335 [Burkholderia ubonensis]KVQ06942.1 hypothetical protein WK00_08800 [Burkholderia ubonensis]KVU22830.1 hypothetical protein WK63_31510 [Burkholderia ubonensis]
MRGAPFVQREVVIQDLTLVLEAEDCKSKAIDHALWSERRSSEIFERKRKRTYVARHELANRGKALQTIHDLKSTRKIAVRLDQA